MNTLEVLGDSDHLDVIEKAVVWYFKKFLWRYRTLKIEITLDKLDGYCGWCEKIDNRTYEITIDNGMDLEDTVSTVFHELIHLKQYARGDLDHSGPKVRWKNNFYSHEMNYKFQPWEKEARKNDIKLMKEFLSTIEI